jgi:NADH dehydrogenase FAD-containing subunit
MFCDIHMERYSLTIFTFSLIQTFGIPSIQEGNGIFFLKQLKHARGIRNNIIDSFEKASVPTVTEAERKRLLSFVVVGGGPTSCEFVSELHGAS